MKVCTLCGQPKASGEYYADKKSKIGLSSYCKLCQKEKSHKWYTSHREMAAETSRKYKEVHAERTREIFHEWYEKNRDKAKARTIAWQKAYPEKVKEKMSKYKIANPEKVKEYRKKSAIKGRLKRKANPKLRLNDTISSGIRSSILRGSKAGCHWEDLVCYTIDQLKKHLEKRFLPGMSWENYGTYWHIDHKIPISVFNFEHPEDIDFRICWSLKNLQPLTAKENIIKSNKLTKPFQPSLVMAV